MGWDGANKKPYNKGEKTKNYWTSGNSGKSIIPRGKSKKEEKNISPHKKS